MNIYKYLGQDGEKINYMYQGNPTPSDNCKRTLDFQACAQEKSTVEYIQFIAKVYMYIFVCIFVFIWICICI
jgi:hypothetical protein